MVWGSKTRKASRPGMGAKRTARRIPGSKPVARLSAPTRRAVAQVAKRAIHVEGKHASGVVVDANFNSSISAASECYCVVPQVSEGQANWQRNGTKVSNGYIYIKGTIQYDPVGMVPDDAQLTPTTVRLMVLEQKNQKDATLIGSRTSWDQLLDPRLGTENAVAYSGTFPSNESAINKKLFRVFADKKFRFNWDYQGNFGSAGAAAGSNLTKHFTIKIKCPASLGYDPSVSSNLPVNFAPFLCLGYTYDTSVAPDFLSAAFKVRVLSTMYFKDA